MPLLNPVKVTEVLQEARKTSAQRTLQEILNTTLPVEEIVEAIADVCRDSGSQSLKLRAAEVAARLHGLGKSDDIIHQPIVNIIIRDSPLEINPIVIPRTT